MIKKCLYFLFLWTVWSCKPSVETQVKEIRIFEVGGIEKDSIWLDTVFIAQSRRSDLSRLISKVDSILANSPQGINTEHFSIFVSSQETVNGVRYTKYFVDFPIDIGKLSYFGVNIESIGTVYWRWLDGYQYLLLRQKISGGHRYYFDSVLNYLDTTIMVVPPIPKEFDDELNCEIELDTSILRK